jgi:outer membrane protein assembly factor BamB
MLSYRLAWLLALVCVSPALAADWPQFRGPDRTGISAEKGLLQSWPKEGPKLLWTYRDAGLGFSCPIVVGDRIYTMGGWDDGEYLLCIDMKKQKEAWRIKVGKLFTYGNWGDGPRSSPTVDGDMVYALGGHGDLVCVKTDGKEVWRKSFDKDFAGEMMSEWGYSESPLVDGKWLIVTPGGAKGTLAALDKKTGNVVWRSAGLTHGAPYSSVMISNAAGVKQYIQTGYLVKEEEGFVSGFDAATGKPLWTQQMFKKHSYAIAPTPIIDKDSVYVTSGYGGGCHRFEITKGDKGLEAKEKYSDKAQKSMKNTHGGVVLIDGNIYGHSEGLGWSCQELKSGKILWNDRVSLECRSGAIMAADGRLYLLGDDGEVVLLEISAKDWSETGRFKLPEASKLRQTRETLASAAVWTIPVLANGRLYLRDQELIFCFDVKK